MKPAGKPLIWAVIVLLVLAIGTMVWFGTRLGREPEPAPPPAAPPAPAPRPDLAAVLQFEAPDSCELAEPLISIFDAMLQAGGNLQANGLPAPVFVPGLDKDIIPVVRRARQASGGDLLETTLPLEGTWNSLQVMSLQITAFDASDRATNTILFADPADKVRDALNEQGFSLLPVGESRTIGSDDGIARSIGVKAVGAGSVLSCG